MALVQQRPATADRAAAMLDKPATLPERPPRPAWLYTAALQPTNEPQRLNDLRGCAILDTEADEDYDRLVQLATVLCGAPMGALTLVDANRQWYKSRVGLPVTQIAREKSFCAHAILEPDRVREIPDVAKLGWAVRQPWGPHGPALGFYAGVPLRTREGSAIGTLCVMDQVPRRLTEGQR